MPCLTVVGQLRKCVGSNLKNFGLNHKIKSPVCENFIHMLVYFIDCTYSTCYFYFGELVAKLMQCNSVRGAEPSGLEGISACHSMAPFTNNLNPSMDK